MLEKYIVRDKKEQTVERQSIISRCNELGYRANIVFGKNKGKVGEVLDPESKRSCQ